MLYLFRLISGYITVAFSGENCEEMLNLCAKHSVKIWNLHLKKGMIIGDVKAKDFSLLRKIRPKRSIKIHILRRRGIPFKTVRYKKRLGLLIGVISFFLILEFLSSFIWNIEITGNNIVKDTEILKICEELGVNPGTKTKDIDTLKTAQKLLIKHNKLAWASLNIEGSLLTVNVSEIKNEKDKNAQNPSNIVATADGKIERIDVTSGNVLVKIGDTVQKGDILVSGIIESLSSTCFVNSKGSVEALVEREFKVTGSYEEEQSYKTGKVKTRNVLEVFSVKIPLYLGEEKSDNKSSFNDEKFQFLGVDMPVIKHSRTMEITSKKKIIYTEDELLLTLKNRLQKSIEKASLQILEEGDIETEFTDTGITLKKSVISRENIAENQAILINSIN